MPTPDFVVSPHTSLHIYFRQIRLGLALALALTLYWPGHKQFSFLASSFSLTLTTSVDIAHTPRRTMANTPHRSAAAGPQKPSSIRKHENDNRQFIEAQLSLSLSWCRFMFLCLTTDPCQHTHTHTACAWVRRQFLACCTKVGNTKHNRGTVGQACLKKSSKCTRIQNFKLVKNVRSNAQLYSQH